MPFLAFKQKTIKLQQKNHSPVRKRISRLNCRKGCFTCRFASFKNAWKFAIIILSQGSSQTRYAARFTNRHPALCARSERESKTCVHHRGRRSFLLPLLSRKTKGGIVMLRLIAIFFILSLLFRRPRYHHPPFMGWGMGFPFMGGYGCHHHRHHHHHHGPYGMF